MSNDKIKIALVNKDDEIIGFEDKLEVHKLGLLHRAFSILIYNDKNEILLQKRASTKYHSPGLWTNTCCSHLIENQDFETYMHDRLQDEMGFDCDLEFQFKFTYKKSFDNGLTEYETDHVYTGVWEGVPKTNPDEVDEYKWMSMEDIKKDIIKNPDSYTYWFKEIISRSNIIV